MDHRPGHGPQRGLYRREVLVPAPDHEGQRPGVGADHPARDRGVGESEARFGRLAGHAARAFHVDGGAVDQQGALRRVGQDVLAIGLPDMAPGRQHCDHGLGFAHGLGDTGGRAASSLDRVRQSRRAEVKGPDVVTGFHLVGGHAAPHVADADEGDPRHVGLL